MLLLLLACTSAKVVPPADTADTADTGAAVGVQVLCGGGSEGELDDLSAWSAVAYRAMLEGGDVTGDGLVRVSVGLEGHAALTEDLLGALSRAT